MPLRLLARLVAGLFSPAMLAAGTVYSQQYPYKPIRILTSDPGGAGDFASRLIAPGLSGVLGQQVVVDNRGGAVVVGWMTGVDMVRIPYKSGATEMADLIGGQVQLAFGTAGTVMPHVKSGKVRALAVSSTKPTALAPGLPTIAESGVAGYETATTAGMWVPAGTPAAVIQRLNQEVARYLNRPEVKEAVSSTSKEFADYIKSDIAKWGKIIKDKGIRDDE